MTRPKVLVLTPRFPYPVIGGDRLRIFELCREMSKYYDLTLLSLCETEEEMQMPLPLDGVFKHVEREFFPRWRSRLNVLMALPTNIPLQVAYYSSKAFSKRIGQLLQYHDGCVAHLIRTGSYVRKNTVPTLLEMTDAISMNYKRVRETVHRPSFRSWVYRIETNRLLRYERRILNEFSLVTLVSEYDRNFLLRGADLDHVIVCSNGVNLDSLPFISRIAAPPIGIYIGNMLSLQNMDACLFFIEEVLPLVRKKIEFVFRVVGRITTEDAKKLRKYEGVEVRENVASIPEAVKDARVGIAPVRIGAGIQNKVLEYMALGLPVVSSTIALEGITAKVSSDLLVADKPREYVNALEVLWNDADLRARLAQNGLAYVRAHHSWPAKVKPMIDAFSSLIKESAG